MTVEQAIAEILQSPQAPSVVRDLEQAMDRERAARKDFHHRIQPHDKWEFINGKIVMHSPARDRHNSVCGRLVHLFATFLDAKGSGIVRFEKALTSFSRNDYEPDICYFRPEKAARIAPDDWKYPVPDLIVEILSPATEETDRGIKFRDYAAHGVEEYWIVDPDREVVEQYLLRDGAYELECKGAEAIITSRVLAGLRLPARAIFDDEERRRAVRGMAAG